eukprot:TRINITY_DN6057_c0_g1_i1.p1 TRINITY_DN6057_c0_g1~~TRINITY_DN6057_c0_g1_i1.p1  ORF type:complete len:110 (+),score=26.87 TRINITY_DN6057_c0_g1_i1:90-419(+)
MSSVEEKKAKKLTELTATARRLFNLTADEDCVQDYGCSFMKSLPVRGHMYITQNFVCFQSSIGNTNLKLSFAKTADIRRSKSVGISKGITLVLHDHEVNQFLLTHQRIL